MFIKQLEPQQKRYLAGLLELACQQLELTESQYKDAKGKYEAVSEWLAESSFWKLMDSFIFPHGSFRLGTPIRPIGRDEFDIDLVCKLTYGTCADHPDHIRNLIGQRFREHDTYRDMLEPINRGWRLNYAESSKFHLDITPAVSNLQCVNGGVLVPDKELKEWKPSHPIGYADWFEEIAQLQPILLLEKAELRATVEPLPDQIRIKGILKRIVQICKRHRDLMFVQDPLNRAPISIIITTLAARSYADVVQRRSYEHELDLVSEVIENLHHYIEANNYGGQPYYVIPNPTTTGENFAEKWNKYPERAHGFFAWQQQALKDINELGNILGLDAIIAHLEKRLIGPEATRLQSIIANRITAARSANLLRTAPATGLSLSSGRPVRANTFYGQ